MKTCAVVCILTLVLAVQAYTDEETQRLEKYIKECLEVSKVDQTLLEEAKKGVFADDPKLKTHALCFSKKIGLQNEKGELQAEKIRDKLNPQMKNKEDVEKLVKLCIVEKDTPENTAFESWKCFYKNIPKDVVIF